MLRTLRSNLVAWALIATCISGYWACAVAWPDHRFRTEGRTTEATVTRKAWSGRSSLVWYDYEVGGRVFEGYFYGERRITLSVGDHFDVVYLESEPEASRRQGHEIEGSWVELVLLCLIPPPLLLLWFQKAQYANGEDVVGSERDPGCGT